MTLQADLIKTLCNKDAFEMYSPYLSKHHFADESEGKNAFFWEIYSVLKEFHNDNDASITPTELKDLHLGMSDGMQKDRKQALSEVYNLVEGARDIATEDSAATHLLTILKRKSMTYEIMNVLEKEVESPSTENWHKIKDIADNAVTAEEAEDVFYTTSIAEASQDYQDSMRWKWFDPEFNDNVQGFGPERTCLVFALTNVGKTSFTVFNCVNFMNQGARVLHFAIAEDSKVSLLRRYYHAAFGKTDRELDENITYYDERFAEKFEGKLWLCPTDALSIARAEQLIKQVRPDIVVFDDFKDLDLGYKAEVKVPRLYGVLAVKIKSLAQKYGFGAICCAQAADSAKGKQILDRADIADSKVDIPAKFEYCIGLSRGENRADNFRFLSLAKNKKGKENISYGYYIDEGKCTWWK